MNPQEDNEDFGAARVPSSLLVTAKVRDGRFVAEFDGQQVTLPYCRFLALLTLIRARQERESGYAFLRDFDVEGESGSLFQAICRLRKELDTACGEGTGKLLIETCGSCTYRLRIASERILIDPSLLELTPVHLPTELVHRLIDNSAVHGQEVETVVD